MEASLDTVQNNSTAGDNTSEEPQGDPEQQQQSLLEGTDRSARPSLSEFKKSWGFRQTTIARREFMDEIIDLDPSPPPMRRGRSRRAKQTPQTTPDTHTTQRPSRASRSVIDDLEWSAPSSPVSVDTEPAPEAGTGGSLDPSLWQDFGSAFHTAFSLLGGKEGMSMEMPDVLAAPVNLEATDDMGTPTIIETTDESDIVEATGNLDTLQCVDAPNDVEVEERDDVLLISSREEDSDDLTLMQLKERLASKGKQEDARGRPGRGGKGKPRGRGRGRGRGKRRGRGRGRGRGRATELESSTADDEGEEEDVILVNQAEQQQLQEEEKESSPERMEVTDVSQSPAQLSNSDCIIIERDLEPAPGGTPGQYDDAPEEQEEEEMEVDKNQEEYSSISDSEGYDPNALYCICRQKHNKRFMISCDRCQEWFHGDCVGISETQGRKMERKGQEYSCPSCTTKKRNKLQPDPQPQTEPHTSLPECPNTTPSDQKEEEATEQQAIKEAAAKKEEPKTEPEPDAEMETDGSLPLCIGPSCSKHALPDSVYCGTDCILQHAAFTMKSLSGPKEPKSRGRLQRKAATPKPTAKGQRSVKVSQRSAGQPEEEEEEEKQGDGRQEEAISPVAGDPSLTAVQATSIPSSKLCTSSGMDSEQVEAKSEPVTPLTQAAEEPSTAASPSSGPVTKPPPLQGNAQDKAKKSFSSGGVSKKQSLESAPPLPTTSSKSSLPSAPETPSTSACRHHESGALKVTKTSFVIPKKQPGSRPPPSHVPASPSGLPPSSAPTLLNETRNLPVSPAPIAPSSRPSQPNNQVRQSIQRSLTSILFKRVCDCDDLEMSESEVGKLVTSIEMEMFDIFRNTDSKYMNKYRTIMFNLKDPRNKGLLYRVVRGEISSFRLARMSQRDMQATKLPEPSIKETTEVKEPAAKAPCLLQKPDTVKVDLPSLSLNTSRSDRTTEQKRSLPPLKTRPSQPSQNSSVPDILSCMLKDTTSEHKTHLFDLKCKICTGQIPAEEEEEPVQKKLKVSESRDKREYGHSFYSSPAERSWRGSGGDDSPLRAPPDSPDMNSPTSLLMESPRLIIDTPALSIMESPASPVVDSPASPILESPASPVMESPASPTPDTPKAKTSVRSYTPVVIPAHSTVTISRRDPRTAASRSSSLSTGTSGPSNTPQSQGVPYGTVKDTISAPPLPPSTSLPPSSILPKSILMKPSSSADPRLYGASSRTMNSHSPADGETAQFLAKQDILWKGFLNMLSVAKFVTKGYLVSGSAENLKADLPDTIQIGGRIMPQTVWDYVAKLKTSVTKELCVIRFHPATEEEEVAYVSLFSYFSSRGRFGVVANNSRSIKDIYLVPLSAKEAIPSKLQPFDGPGLEKNRPNLLLGLAIIQRPKRPGILLQENEEKRPKVHMSKDPMWIPKPPVLYGSDRLEIFQPYDPETPINTTPPGSPPSTGSPSDSSSSGSITIPTLLTSTRETPPVSSSAPAPATSSTSNTVSDKNPTTTSTDNTTDNTPLQTILKTLFGNKPSDSVAPAESSSTITTVGAVKLPKPPQVPQPMVDPIVQQYGQKSKVKEIEEEENEYDRPYDPEEEYDPAMGYVMVAPHSLEKIKTDAPAPPSFGEDDVAYDPEDDTIFEDMQNEAVRTKALASVQGSAPTPCPAPTSTQVPTPVPTPASDQTSTTTPVLQNLPTGTVVVSAATLTEQQRMLEELNKQIEEQKRQLKEQEEALRQQREAVGMFMAHFSVSDSLMSPPSKSLPLSQINSQQSDVEQSESKPSESTDKMNDLTKPLDNQSVDSQTVTTEDTTTNPELKTDPSIVTEQGESEKNVQEPDQYSSAGEIEDSDVAYDPEDESLFNEMQDDVFQGGSVKTRDSALSGTSHGASRRSTSNSYHGRRHRQSPKRQSRRDRERRGTPPRRSQRRSPSHSRRRKEGDRHRRSERDRSRHRARDQSERQGRHRRDRASRRHSRGPRTSPASPSKRDSVSFSPRRQRGPSPQVLQESKHQCALSNIPVGPDLGPLVENKTPSHTPVTIKNDPDGPKFKSDIVEFATTQQTNLDKDSILTHDFLPTVKLENEEPQSLEPQKLSISDHQDTESGPPQQVDSASQQELMFKNKIESTVPLRELDPPIRDSPQSPDPEPQFVKYSSIEKNDSDKAEEDKDPVPEISHSAELVSAETSCLPIGAQPTSVDMKWPGIGGPCPNMRGPDIRGPDLRGPGYRGQCMGGVDNQMERRSPGLRHPEMLGQGIKHLSSGSNNRGSGPDLGVQGPEMIGPGMGIPGPDVKVPGMQSHSVDRRGPESEISDQGMSGLRPEMCGPGMRGPGPDMTGPGIRGPGPCIGVPGIRGPGPDIRGLGIMGPGPDMMRLGIRGPGPDMTGPGIMGPRPNMTGPGIRAPGPDMIGIGTMGPGPDMIGPGIMGQQTDMREPGITGGGQYMRSPGMRGINPDSWGPGPNIRNPGMRDQRPDLKGQEPNMRGPDIQDRNLDRIGSRPAMRGTGMRDETDMEGPGIQGVNLERSGPGPSMREQELETRRQRQAPAVTNSHMRVSDLQNERRGLGINNLEIQGPTTRDPSTVVRGPWADNTGPHMRGMDIRGPIPDMRVLAVMAESTGLDVIPQSCLMGSRPDIRGPGTEKPHQDMMDCGPDMMDERCSGMSDLCPEMRDQGLDIIGRGRGRGRGRGKGRGRGWGMRDCSPERGLGPRMRGPSPGVRGESPESGIRRRGQSPGFKCPGPDRRGPGISSPGPFQRSESPGGPRPNIRNPQLDLRGQSPDMGTRPDRRGPGPEIGGPESSLICPGPTMRGRGSDRRGQNPDFRTPGPDTSTPGQDTRSRCLREPSPNVRGPGPAMKGPGQDWKEPRHDRGSRSEERGPRLGRRGFKPNIRDSDRGGVGQDSGPVFDRRGLRHDSHLEPEASPGSDIRDERSGQGPNMRGSQLRHEVREADTRGAGYRGSGDRSGPDKRGERSGSHSRDTRQDVGETGPDMGDQGIQGPIMRGPWPDQRNEQRGQEVRGPTPDMRNPDWRGHGPNAGGPQREDEWRGPDHIRPDMRGERSPSIRDPDWIGPGLEMRDEWRVTDGTGPGPVMRGPGIQDEWKGHGPDRRAPNMEGPGPGRRRPVGQDFSGPRPERRGLDMEGPGPDRRRPVGPDVRGPGPERRGPDTEGPGLDMRRPGFPDFSGPRPERRGLDMEGPGSDRRRLVGPDFRGPGPERRGPDTEGMGPDMRGPGGPDISELRPEWRGPDMESPGPDRRRPVGPDFRGAVPERRGPDMEGEGPDMRGQGGPDFRGPGPERRGADMEGPGPDRRGPGGPDFRGPGPEGRSPFMEGPGPERRGPGGPDFRGLGPDRRGSGGPDFRGPGPDRRGPGGPDFRGLGPERRGPDMEGPGPDRRGSGGPDFRGPGPEGRGPFMEGPGSERRGPGGDFRGPGPDRRGPGGPDFRGPGPDRRGPGGPDFRGPGPDRRGPGGPDFRGPGPDRRGPEGSDFRVSGPDRRGPEVPDFRRGSNAEGPGYGRRGLREEWEGESFRAPWLNREATDMESPGPDRRGPGDEWRGPDIRNAGPDGRGPGLDMNSTHMGNEWRGPGFSGPRPERMGPDMEGPWPDTRGQHMEGPGPERRGPGGPGYRGPGPIHEDSDIEGQGHGRRGSGNEWRGPNRGEAEPDRRGHGSDFRRERDLGGMGGKGQDMRGPNMGDDQRQLDFRDIGPNRRGPNIERLGSEERGPGIGSDWRGPDMEWRGPDRRGFGPDFRGDMRGPNIEGPGPDRRDPDFRSPGPNRRSLDMEGPGPGRRGPGVGDEWSGSDSRGRESSRRGPNFKGPVSERQGLEMEGPGPSRTGPEQELRRERRSQDMRGPGLDGKGLQLQDEWRGTDLRGSGSERRDTRGPDMAGPGLDTRGPESNFKEDMQGPARGPGSDNRGPDTRSREQGLWDPTQGNEKRGPDRREPDSRHSDMSTSTHFNSPRMHLHNQGNSETQMGQQGTRFQAPTGPHSSLFNRPIGPGPDIGGQPRLRFDSPHNQPTVRPLKHKAPLLPTPTEGLVRLPHRLINAPDAFSKNRLTSNSPDSHGREWNRVTGRTASRERELDRQVGRQEMDRSSGGNISTPLGVSSVGEKMKVDSDTDKHRDHGMSEQSKASQIMDCDINTKERDGEPKEKQNKNDNPDTPQDSKGST